MGGGRGSRLHPLTHQRSKPAVPLAGKYRLVDIPISNCLNSGLSQIYILTQFNSESLNRHISNTYKFDQFHKGFVSVLAAQQTPSGDSWYQGTADAVRQNLSYFLQHPDDHFMILSGDQLYRMDLQDLLAYHIENKADLTISTTPVSRSDAQGFGIMHTDDDGRIVRFVEKPQEPDLLDSLKMSPQMLKTCDLDSDSERYQASMGIYVFSRKILEECLNNDHEDFGKHIIPGAIEEKRVFSYVFSGYWEDIGTIKSFYEANLELTDIEPRYNFFDNDNPIYTHARFLPASKVNNAKVDRALISDGCIISDSKITNSIIGVRSIIEKGCEVTDSVIMGADYYYRTRAPGAEGPKKQQIRIGENTRIRKAIIDKNAIIGSNVTIDPRDRDDEEGENYVIRDGIVVIPKSTIIPDNTTI